MELALLVLYTTLSKFAMATALRPAGSDANEVEVRWEDQQQINQFGALTNARDELKDQIAYCKV